MGGIDEQHIGKRHRRFDVQNGAELAGADHVAQLGHFRMETAIVTECERDAGLAHRGDGILRFALGERERLLAVHVLPGRRRGDHLRGMHGMRRGQNHRIDPRVREQLIVTRREPQTLLLGERLDLRCHRASGAGHEADGVAVLGRLNKRLAPPAKSDDAGFDHSENSSGNVGGLAEGVTRRFIASSRRIALC